jgi:hypothetical protein
MSSPFGTIAAVTVPFGHQPGQLQARALARTIRSSTVSCASSFSGSSQWNKAFAG